MNSAILQDGQILDEVKTTLMNNVASCGKRTIAIKTLKYHGFSVTFVSFGFTSPATLTVKLTIYMWKLCIIIYYDNYLTVLLRALLAMFRVVVGHWGQICTCTGADFAYVPTSSFIATRCALLPLAWSLSIYCFTFSFIAGLQTITYHGLSSLPSPPALCSVKLLANTAPPTGINPGSYPMNHLPPISSFFRFPEGLPLLAPT